MDRALCLPQAVDRAERLSVSALKALSNLMEALGEEANAALCHGGDNGVMTSVEDASQKQKVRREHVIPCRNGVRFASWGRLLQRWRDDSQSE